MLDDWKLSVASSQLWATSFPVTPKPILGELGSAIQLALQGRYMIGRRPRSDECPQIVTTTVLLQHSLVLVHKNMEALV